MALIRVLILVAICGAIAQSGQAQEVGETNSFVVLQLLRHEKTSVTKLAWSPSGQYLVTAGKLMRDITVWDSKTGRIVHKLETGVALGDHVAFSKDGQLLITSVTENKAGAALSIWRTSDWQIIRQVSSLFADEPVKYSAARMFSLSDNGKRLAYIAAQGPGNPIGVLDTDTWGTRAVFKPDRDTANALAIAPDGRRLEVGTIAGKIMAFDIDDQRLVRVIDAYPAESFAVGVDSLAYSPDGQVIASGPTISFASKANPGGGYDRIAPPADPLRLWRVSDGSLFKSKQGAFGAIRGIDWSPNGRYVSFAAGDHSIRLWDLQMDTLVTAFKFDKSAVAVAFSPDGKRLAAAGPQVVAILQIP